MARAARNQPARKKLGCANLAHGFAARGPEQSQGCAAKLAKYQDRHAL
jgi:hypothetical protein